MIIHAMQTVLFWIFLIQMEYPSAYNHMVGRDASVASLWNNPIQWTISEKIVFRFKKCLSCGMKVSWVLSDDERNRFKFNVHFVGENIKNSWYFHFFRRFNKFNKVGTGKGRAQFQPEEQSLLPTPGPTSQLYMGFTIGRVGCTLNELCSWFQLKELQSKF